MNRPQDVDESENMQPRIARSNPHLALLQDIGRVLARAPSENDALTMIVERIRASLQWEYGACWHEDGDRSPRSRKFCARADWLRTTSNWKSTRTR